MPTVIYTSFQLLLGDKAGHIPRSMQCDLVEGGEGRGESFVGQGAHDRERVGAVINELSEMNPMQVTKASSGEWRPQYNSSSSYHLVLVTYASYSLCLYCS